MSATVRKLFSAQSPRAAEYLATHLKQEARLSALPNDAVPPEITHLLQAMSFPAQRVKITHIKNTEDTVQCSWKDP